MTKTVMPANRRSPRAGFLVATLQRPVWVRCYYIIGILICLEVAVRLVNDKMFLSPPSEVIPAIFSLLADPKILSALGQAFVEIIVAFALSVVVGVLAGLLLGLSRFAYHLFYRLVITLYSLPKIIIFPMLLVAFGIGPAMKIAFGFVHGVFPVLIAVVAGLQDRDESLARAAMSMGAKPKLYFRWVILPRLLESLFTGMRLSMAGVLLGVTLAELYVSVQGIGYYTSQFSQNFQPAQLFALIVVLAVVPIALNESLRGIEKHYSRWRASAERK